MGCYDTIHFSSCYTFLGGDHGFQTKCLGQNLLSYTVDEDGILTDDAGMPNFFSGTMDLIGYDGDTDIYHEYLACFRLGVIQSSYKTKGGVRIGQIEVYDFPESPYEMSAEQVCKALYSMQGQIDRLSAQLESLNRRDSQRELSRRRW